jgi:hypothetical protein
MHNMTIIISLAAVLSGCVTAEERARQLAETDDATCLSWGVQKGTPPYVQCRSARRAARHGGCAAAADRNAADAGGRRTSQRPVTEGDLCDLFYAPPC